MSRDFETLSAFLDGETNDFETRRVLRDLNPADLDTLGRWQLARDAMHGQATMAVPASFNARLSQALAQEEKPARRSNGMVGGFARVAVAASVAAATVLGWQYWSAPVGGVNPTLAANDSAAPAVPAMMAAEQRLSRPFGEASLVSQTMRPEAKAATVNTSQPRVNAMMLRHSEFAARHSGQGMMPYARLVSMDARDGAR
ncbi:sigma-E factor negative regulatory protein [Alloalcanivorax mobilis]|uniref:sigma-E factor negative regulatory protein n=1 Tax=Alloalcanivorax mobilis TaxID=2019569 RepID=UPI000B5B4707|nr:sigma-E factor negative regulatory protein [Alloalcanivorax mobilis]ASK33485.1 RNA polymerase subunit sigma [Alcanivorax sp. N3-2A]|tara:strand:- start:41628 stop:42227 length:600 start_codon:yes stop_codon:yes gene_type:complete